VARFVASRNAGLRRACVTRLGRQHQRVHCFLRRFSLLTVCLSAGALSLAAEQVVEADLFIVGGNESGCAAAVQAARLGVPHIVLVNDIEWLDGLFGCSNNIGYSSVVSSAVRLHGHMMHVGQAVGTAAWLCLRDATKPRDLACDWARVRELQTRLVRSAGGPGVLLWPFHDLAPDDLRFEAANQLAVRGIWQADPNSLDFNAWQNVTA